MFTRIIAICLLFALFGSGFSRFFVYAGFELNSKYIAENLCINRNRPEMHCNGKCYLMNKVRQAEEKEKKQQREILRSSYQEAMPASAFQFTFIRPVIISRYPQQPVPGILHRSTEFFQPPKLSV
jgi:hypothetical protein